MRPSGEAPPGPADTGGPNRQAGGPHAVRRSAGGLLAALRSSSVARTALAATLAGLGAALVLLGLAWVPAGPPVARGACADSPSIDDAIARGSILFVGTVVALENDDRWATVRVEERWYAAASLPEDVQVHGGPGPGTSTTFDRVYARARYLFVVEPGSGYYQDSACTATATWRDDLARFRPEGVVPATGDPLPTSRYGLDDAVVVGALVTALAIAVISYLLILRARRRPPDWIR